MAQNTSSSDENDDRTQRFIALLATCDRRLYSYILSLVGSFHDADDIAQETKTRLWKQFDEYDPAKDFGSWACTVAHYQILHFRDRTRHARLHFSHDFVEAIADEAATPAANQPDYEGALVHCMRQLDAAARELMRLVYVARRPAAEVAERTGRSLAATYQATWRIRKALRACVERRLAREEAP